MTTHELMEQLERSGVPGRRFWEDDLEMAVDPVLRSVLEKGFVAEWTGKLSGRQVAVLCHIAGLAENGSAQKMKAALGARREDLLPYLLVDHFSKYKSKVAAVELARGILAPALLQICKKNGDENYDTTAILFALYKKAPTNLRLAFHLDKIHKTGFARMKLTSNPRKPAQSFQEVLQTKRLGNLLENFDKSKRDGRWSELKEVVGYEGRFLVFIRRAERPDLILGNGGILHGYKPEWIILDFEEGAKRVNISSVSVSVPLEIANRIASEHYGQACEYDNESEVTYEKQIGQLLKNLCEDKAAELPLVELVAGSSALDGSPKIKITDPDSNPIGAAIAHFERAIGGLLDEIPHLESVKVLFRKKRVSLIFERLDGTDGEYVVRYSDHRLNAVERRLFEDYMRETHGIPILSTEKRFKR